MGSMLISVCMSMCPWNSFFNIYCWLSGTIAIWELLQMCLPLIHHGHSILVSRSTKCFLRMEFLVVSGIKFPVNSISCTDFIPQSLKEMHSGRRSFMVIFSQGRILTAFLSRCSLKGSRRMNRLFLSTHRREPLQGSKENLMAHSKMKTWWGFWKKVLRHQVVRSLKCWLAYMYLRSLMALTISYRSFWCQPCSRHFEACGDSWHHPGPKMECCLLERVSQIF